VTSASLWTNSEWNGTILRMTADAPRVQRRLAAILAADVAGFSALMGRDEEGTLAQVKALQQDVINPAVQQHHGRVVKTTGDGFLIEFASPVEAVRCALVIQKALASGPLQLRIGINLGDVIIEPDGDIYGEGVNVAARLEALCDPGGVLISGKVYDEAEGKVEATFECRGEQHVKNIVKPVWVYALGLSSPKTTSIYSKALPLPDRPSIAVLPFTNMSGDPEQDYFADGVVEDIITALSHFSRLFVIARNSSFTYKGRAVDVRQVGQELGVRYVLEGSVRRSGERLRLTGQLIDTRDGAHLWAERFDGSMQDIFALQDEMTSRVVGAIAPRLQIAEIERAKRNRPDSLDAYDLYLRALAAVREMTLKDSEEALAYVDRALKIDPEYAVAAGLGAWASTLRVAQNWPVDREIEKQRGFALGRLAVLKGQEDADALGAGGYAIAFLGGQLQEGLRAIERAITLNPNNAMALQHAGWVRNYSGQAQQAIEALERAVRLSPRDPMLYRAHAARAVAHLLLGELEETISWGLKAVEENPNYNVTYRALAAAYAYAGRPNEARNMIERLSALVPGITIRGLPEHVVFSQSGRLDYFIDGLRLAGLPE
jgi:adenylate cyclase